jgi:hypothetical protein
MTSDDGIHREHGRKALVILGMHRSGTSLLAYLLHRLGASLPADIIGPGRGNILGHWEPKNLVEINDDAFRTLNRRWDDVRSIDLAWFSSQCAAGFVQRIRLQILQDYGTSELLLIKDPRICRLLPLYLATLRALGIDPLIILLIRPAQQVIMSLTRRDGISPELSALLWVRSILEAERYSRHCRRVWMTFDRIVASRGEALDHIAARLGISWPDAPATLAFDHTIGAPPPEALSCPAAEVAPWLVSQVWSSAEQAMSGDESHARYGFDTLWQALEDMDRIYAAHFTKLSGDSEAMLNAVLCSTSWRVTRPLRAMKSLGQRILGSGATPGAGEER